MEKFSNYILTSRRLAELTNTTSTWSYQYDSGGMRLSKSNGTASTEYLYSGTSLLREKRGTDTIWYIYSETGLVGFQLNGTTYYYVRNLQGDVMKIVSSTGTVLWY